MKLQHSCLPDVRIGNCILYCGDCYEILPHISGASMLLTDPPYAATVCEWDKNIDLELFWRLAYAATKTEAACCVFCQMPFAAELYASNRRDFRYDYVYVKPKLSRWLDANRKPLRAHESVYVFSQIGRTKYNPQKTPGKSYRKGRGSEIAAQTYGWAARQEIVNATGERYPTTIMAVKHDTCFYTGSKKDGIPVHPSQKSVSACSLLIKTYTDSGEIVLDPFMGSGSTGVACVDTGRLFIGIEREEKYFETACRRIERAYQKRGLLEIRQ